MVNILGNIHSIHDDWCYGAFRPYIRPTDKVALVLLSYRESKLSDASAWDSLYGAPYGIYYQGFAASFAAYGIPPEQLIPINYFTDTPQSAREKIEAADILYLPGGLPDKMLERLETLELVDVIRQHQGLVIGYSAGAMLQLDEYHITPDKDYPEYCYKKGLGLLSGFDVEVHYEALPVQQDAIRRYLSEQKKPIYAMGNQGALIVENGSILPVGDVSLILPEESI